MRNRFNAITGAAAVAAAMLATGMASGVASEAAAPVGTPHVGGVRLVDIAESLCGAHALCPDSPAPESGDQATAEQRVIDGYVAKQKGCTPETPANPQSITWDAPGFTPNEGGSGDITDANPGLGGHFRADWVNGRWHIEYMYC